MCALLSNNEGDVDRFTVLRLVYASDFNVAELHQLLDSLLSVSTSIGLRGNPRVCLVVNISDQVVGIERGALSGYTGETCRVWASEADEALNRQLGHVGETYAVECALNLTGCVRNLRFNVDVEVNCRFTNTHIGANRGASRLEFQSHRDASPRPLKERVACHRVFAVGEEPSVLADTWPAERITVVGGILVAVDADEVVGLEILDDALEIGQVHL